MSDLLPRNHIARAGVTLRHLFPAAIGRAEVPCFFMYTKVPVVKIQTLVRFIVLRVNLQISYNFLLLHHRDQFQFAYLLNDQAFHHTL